MEMWLTWFYFKKQKLSANCQQKVRDTEDAHFYSPASSLSDITYNRPSAV